MLSAPPSPLHPLLQALRVREHPLLPLPLPAEIETIMELPGGAESLTDALNKREELIDLVESDAYTHGMELPHWLDADRLLYETPGVSELLVLGGNRAAKSEWAGKRVVKTVVLKPKAVAWCLHTTNDSSIEMQQPIIFKYLPKEWVHAKKTAVTNILYSVKNGFADGKLVGPNGAQIIFKNYAQKPDVIEGGECDMIWADELVPLDWIRTLRYRIVTRRGKLIVTFTPIKGYSLTVKEYVAGAKTLESKPAELLKDSAIPGGKPGEMPYIQQPACYDKARITYFHSILNPFGNYPGIVDTLQGATTSEIRIRAYGFADKLDASAFPLFGDWNIIDPENIPGEGTNYVLIDPAGGRNWFIIWWRVVPGNPPKHFIYREWPDLRRFGPWAETSRSQFTYDGDAGPAQRSIGYGVEQYKQLMLREEKIFVPPAIAALPAETSMEVWGPMVEMIREAHHRHVIRQALRDGADLADLREPIYERRIDPRAGRSQHVTEKGGSCLIDDFAKEQRDPNGNVTGAKMIVWPSPGLSIEEGLNAINTLLFWDKDRDLQQILNEPRLYVSRNCGNVIWAMQNWTGQDGEKGASKDPIDNCRYGATGELRHVDRSGRVKTRGGGSY